MRISVITPTYNRAGPLLAECIESFIAQDYKDCEQIIVNDGGIDSTDDFVKPYLARDKRIKYYHKGANGGEASAVNYALTKTDADLCCTLYDDDLLTPKSLSARAAIFDANPVLEFIYTSVENIEMNGKVMLYWKATDYPANALKVWTNQYIHMSGVMWKRSIIDKIGNYNEDLWHYCDWDFLIRCLMECQCMPFDVLTFKTRYHPEQKSVIRRNLKRDGPENRKMRDSLNARYKGIFK